MTTAKADVDRAPRPAVSLALWSVAVFAGSRIVGGFLESASMAAIVAQAVVAEWGAGFLGLRWSSEDRGGPSTTRLIARGALTGAIAGALVVGFLVATHAVTLARKEISLPTLTVGLVSAGLYAMRDELLLRGLPLLVMARSGTPAGAVPRVVVCGLLAAAAALGERQVTLSAVIVELVLGLGCGVLWVRSGGAWWPWAAHTAWLFTTALFLQGGLFDARVAASAWGGGAGGALSGRAAVVAVLPLATAAITWAALATDRVRRVR